MDTACILSPNATDSSYRPACVLCVIRHDILRVVLYLVSILLTGASSCERLSTRHVGWRRCHGAHTIGRALLDQFGEYDVNK